MKKVLIPLVIILIMPLFLSQPVHSKSFKASGFSKGGSRVSGFRSQGMGRSGFSGFRQGLSNKGVNSTLRGTNFKNDSGFVKSSFGNKGSGTRFSNNFDNINNTSNLQTSNQDKVRPVSNSPVMSNVKQDRVRFGKKGSNGFNTFKSNALNSNSFNNRLSTRGGLRKVDFNSNDINKSHFNFNKVHSISKGSKTDRVSKLSKINTYNGSSQSFRNRLLNNNNSNRALAKQSDLHTRKTDIVHWIDRKNGVKNFSNNISRVSKDRERITTRNGKRSTPPYRLSTNNTTTSNIQPLRIASTSTSQNALNPTVIQSDNFSNGFSGNNTFSDSNARILSSPSIPQNNVIPVVEQIPISGSGSGSSINRVNNNHFLNNSSHHNSRHVNGSHHALKSKKILHHHNHHDFHHNHHFHHRHFFPFNPIFIDNTFVFFPPFFPNSSFFFVSFPFITPAFINFVPFVFVPVPFIVTPIFNPFIFQPVFFDPFFTPFPFQNDIFFTSLFFD